jgi:predicted acetyltransferase
VIRLRPFRAEDQLAAVAAHRALAVDDFQFLLDYADGEDWNVWLDRLESRRRGDALPEDRVPSTFLAATVEGELVGRISIRHELNDWLAKWFCPTFCVRSGSE